MNPTKWLDLESRRPEFPRPIPEVDSPAWQAYLNQMKQWLKEKKELERESNRESFAMTFERQTPIVTPKADYQFRDLPKGRRKTA